MGIDTGVAVRARNGHSVKVIAWKRSYARECGETLVDEVIVEDCVVYGHTSATETSVTAGAPAVKARVVHDSTA